MAGLLEPPQAGADRLDEAGRRVPLGTPHPQPEQPGVRPRLLQDRERVGQAHRPARAALQDEHLEGLVGAAVRVEEGGGHGVAGHRRTAEVAESAQKGLADLEAGAAVAHGVEAPDHRAVLEDGLTLEHLLRHRRLRWPATEPGGEQQQEGDEGRRRSGRPEAPALRGPPAARVHHSAGQR